MERAGIERDAGDDAIKQAYRRMAKQFHPDGMSLLSTVRSGYWYLPLLGLCQVQVDRCQQENRVIL